MFPYRTGKLRRCGILNPVFYICNPAGIFRRAGRDGLWRVMRTGPTGAFGKAMEMRGKRGGRLIGLIPVIGSLGIAIGYSVVVGWFLKYLSAAVFRNAGAGGGYGSLFCLPVRQLWKRRLAYAGAWP